MLKNTLLLVPKSLLSSSPTLITNSYNFYIDFKGLLYFDDGSPFLYPNCIKDTKFLTNLYKYLKPCPEPTSKYPYQAQFWGERNYIRCAISPVIFNGFYGEGKEGKEGRDRLRYGVGLSVEFSPGELEIDGDGRIWHPFRGGIKGVFSNDLLVECLGDIETTEAGSFYKHGGKVYQIKKIQ